MFSGTSEPMDGLLGLQHLRMGVGEQKQMNSDVFILHQWDAILFESVISTLWHLDFTCSSAQGGAYR